MKFKRLIKQLSFFSLFLFLFIFACDEFNSDRVDNTDSIAEETFSFEVMVENQAGVKVESVNGEIQMTGAADTNAVGMTGVRRVGSDSVEDAKAHLDKLEVRVTDSAFEILVKTIQPKNSKGRNYETDYVITLPEDLEVSINHINGDIMVGKVKETVSVKHINGRIRLDDISGSAFAKLVNGQIDARLTLPTNGTVDIETINGSIDLSIPKSTSAVFSASVVNGGISMVGLDLHDIGVQSLHALRGVLLDGKGKIELTTVNGGIVVRGIE